jgi:type I restriction enzyme R subunit
MTEFKQTIGRGTRINEDYNKYYFTIIDFKKATELFADPDFDGDPVQVYAPKSLEDSPVPPDFADNEAVIGDFAFPLSEESGERAGVADVGEYQPVIRRYVVANVEVKVVAERVQYFDANGKLITESLKAYTRRTLAREFASLDDFLKRWSSTEKKQAIMDELANEGVVHIEEPQILSVTPFTNFGTPIEIIRAFGGLDGYQHAVHELEQALYCA